MTNVDTLRFLIDQANRMDDDTPKKVRRHMVDMLAEAIKDVGGENVKVVTYTDWADERGRWQISFRHTMDRFGYHGGWLKRAEEYGGGGPPTWISSGWEDAADIVAAAVRFVDAHSTFEVEKIRADLVAATKTASPLPFEELVARAGGRVVPDGVDVLAVWPNGATVENPDPDVAFGPVPPTGIQTHEGRLVWTGAEIDALTLARATGATCVASDARSPVSAVWPDGRFLRTGDGGYFMSWPDGRCKWHHDLSVALDCDGECEQ